jgi:hypothetical protein
MNVHAYSLKCFPTYDPFFFNICFNGKMEAFVGKNKRLRAQLK